MKANAWMRNPFEDYSWLMDALAEHYGRENLIFQEMGFGRTLALGVEQVRNGEFFRHAIKVRGVRCKHGWKHEGEEGYGTECQDNSGMHETYDLNEKAGRRGKSVVIKEVLDDFEKAFSDESSDA